MWKMANTCRHLQVWPIIWIPGRRCGPTLSHRAARLQIPCDQSVVRGRSSSSGAGSGGSCGSKGPLRPGGPFRASAGSAIGASIIRASIIGWSEILTLCIWSPDVWPSVTRWPKLKLGRQMSQWEFSRKRTIRSTVSVIRMRWIHRQPIAHGTRACIA